MKKVREDERELKEEREGRKRHKSGVQRIREMWTDRERERERGGRRGGELCSCGSGGDENCE